MVFLAFITFNRFTIIVAVQVESKVDKLPKIHILMPGIAKYPINTSIYGEESDL